MTIPEKLTVRLGDLRQPLEAWCTTSGQTPSGAVRDAVAAMLGVRAPEMAVGNPDIAKQSKKGIKARWNLANRQRSP